MEWLEANPLPSECQNCQENDCYNCDTAGERWYLSEKDELMLRRKGLMRAAERLQRQIEDIDRKLAQLCDSEDKPNVPMTQELWEHCIGVCVEDGNVAQFDKLWSAYPEYAENVMREFEGVATQSHHHPTEEEIRASWERFKARMRAERGEDFI